MCLNLYIDEIQLNFCATMFHYFNLSNNIWQKDLMTNIYANAREKKGTHESTKINI